METQFRGSSPNRFLSLARRALPALCLIFGAVVPLAAKAATFCANSAFGLLLDLDTARTNGENDTIRIAQGFYTVPTGGFVYDASMTGSDDKDLTLIGGWSQLNSDPCGASGVDPLSTTLYGSLTDPILTLVGAHHGSFTVKQLTFLGGQATAGGAIHLQDDAGDYDGDITIERNAFIGNSASVGGGLWIYCITSFSFTSLNVVNNLFSNNQSSTDYGGAANLMLDYSNGLIRFTNNTIVGNHTTATTSTAAGGVYFSAAQGDGIDIYNNNFWNNDVADISVATGNQTSYVLRNNDIDQILGTQPGIDENNFHADPQFIDPNSTDIALQYTPKRSSPLVDAGRTPGPAMFFYLTNSDLAGIDRTIGTVDIGAYENDLIFADGFETPSP